MFLTISIPTYNRAKELKYNLSLLEEFINNNKWYNEIKVLVSNNNSTDETSTVLDNFKNKTKINIAVYHQDRNIGLERNFVFVIENAKSDFVMLLGDDDYISEGYLKLCLSCLKTDTNLKCIFGCYKSIDIYRNEIGGGRDLDLPTKKWEPGLESAIENTAKFHQMSGIVFSKDEVLEEYKSKRLNNLYPQVFIGTYYCLHAKVMQITEFPILVTQTPKKAWSYGNDGLVQDVFQNYTALTLNIFERYLLENSFLTQQIWRIWQYKETGGFWKCVFRVCFGRNTSLIGSILLFLKIVKTRLKEVKNINL